jgi:hypothetical protein
MGSARIRAIVSYGPPAGKGTSIVIGRAGYGCALAMPDMAKSAAAPAAKRRKFLRGNVITFPPEMQVER